MLNRSPRPSRASPGRRSHSDGGLFADENGVIHIRIPHKHRGNRRTKSYRTTLISLHCEKGGVGIEDITAVPEGRQAFPTCVRCISMESQ
jgi:hypothetical protein